MSTQTQIAPSPMRLTTVSWPRVAGPTPSGFQQVYALNSSRATFREAPNCLEHEADARSAPRSLIAQLLPLSLRGRQTSILV
jgi:hypothetical protein